MKIAVVGAGISGLTALYLLSPHHDVHLFEQDARLGGHTHTVPVHHEDRLFHVDTGFIVFNDRNYPHFSRLLHQLDVPSRPTSMSFSVHDAASSFEYGGSSLAGLVGSPTNLFRARWWSVVRGVATLARRGKPLLSDLPPDATIADLCRGNRFSQSFLNDYLLPMASAIWSAPREDLLRFPACFFLRFFDNHGMLDLRRRPTWRTVVGGSHAYVTALVNTSRSTLHTAQPVLSMTRFPDHVRLRTAAADHTFDHVILATHSDQALGLLDDVAPDERTVLGAMPYQPNDAVLHTDARVLPRRRRCWAAWNYRLAGDPAAPPIVTYNMSILQGLATRSPICVTLNDPGTIDPTRIVGRFTYHHPLYTTAGDAARARWRDISNRRRTHFCGAYWGNGFHEDGVVSALRVCEDLGVKGGLQ